jgi:hypothetical protein
MYPYLDTMVSGALLDDYLTYDREFVNFGDTYNPAYHRTFTSIGGNLDIDTCSGILTMFESSSGSGYSTGLGMVFETATWVTTTSSFALICYEKGLEVSGTCVDVLLHNDPDIEKVFKVYPDPATDYIHVDAGSNADLFQWKLFADDGRLMMEGEFRYTSEIEVSGLPAGLYLLRISDGIHRPVCRRVTKL